MRFLTFEYYMDAYHCLRWTAMAPDGQVRVKVRVKVRLEWREAYYTFADRAVQTERWVYPFISLAIIQHQDRLVTAEMRDWAYAKAIDISGTPNRSSEYT